MQFRDTTGIYSQYWFNPSIAHHVTQKPGPFSSPQTEQSLPICHMLGVSYSWSDGPAATLGRRDAIVKIKINKAGIRRLQRKIEQQVHEQLGDSLQVSKGGSEDDTVRSVENQLRKAGLTPNAAEIRRIVRDARTKDTSG